LRGNQGAIATKISGELFSTGSAGRGICGANLQGVASKNRDSKKLGAKKGPEFGVTFKKREKGEVRETNHSPYCGGALAGAEGGV